jgi:hypothetical protein
MAKKQQLTKEEVQDITDRLNKFFIELINPKK